MFGLQVRLLVLVKALVIRLPGDDRRAWDRQAIEILDTNRDGQGLADAVKRYRGSGPALRRIVAEKGAANCIGRRPFRPAGIDRFNQCRSARQIRQQHPLLAALVGGVSDIRQERDDLAPVFLRRPELLDEVMDMGNGGGEQLRDVSILLTGQPLGKHL
ncbi:conserved hypothetical protein [Ricinus communis]|uniref:Uncharacterized protein n=1 Tax=Ricinus communis TaxID=3988 RepID=B9TFY3_RICCO|nr:conserved hypothetical protein [Ricinus communis]